LHEANQNQRLTEAYGFTLAARNAVIRMIEPNVTVCALWPEDIFAG
jgi:hypothetical protein